MIALHIANKWIRSIFLFFLKKLASCIGDPVFEEYTFCAGFSALYGLFSERPGPGSLSPELNAQLVSALYQYKPNLNDPGNIM